MTLHPQVTAPGTGITCDSGIAGLIGALNRLGAATVNSCQDNNAGRGTVRRVWVEMPPEDAEYILTLLTDPAETPDLESLSNRIAACYEPPDWEAFRADRAWHYTAHVSRNAAGRLLPLTVGIRFPHSDLAEVTGRLHAIITQGRGGPPGAAG